MKTIRIGNGFDVHPLTSGRDFMLGGVRIPSDVGPVGHSDGDVLLHALTDALLGATGQPDIGTRFKNSDPAWKNAASSIFVERVWSEIAEKGWSVGNVDCTVLLERPKIGPYRDHICAAIAKLLRCPVENVSVKATTCEGLGYVGRGEGVAASVSLLLMQP